MMMDHLGSTNMVTDSSGTLLEARSYKAFGETASQSGAVTTDVGYTGQRQEPELGLYFYNARWYDPVLGRFAQADTIVPNPTDAKAFDRYAYVNNNPVRYNDPSGHMCSDPDAPTMNCENNSSSGYGNNPLNWWEATVSLENIEQIAGQLGIEFSGDWTDTDKQVILHDVLLLAARLREAAGYNAMSLPDVFKIAHGEKYKISLTAMDGYCAAGTGSFSCNSGNLRGRMGQHNKQGLTIHEMGHSFDHYVTWGGGRSSLANAEIRDNYGNLVAGQGIRTNDGYRSMTFPDQQHPRDAQDGLGNNGFEDYADMYMNWAQNSFATDEAGAGTARYQWMNQHVISRVHSQALNHLSSESTHTLGRNWVR
jgi:RHS repeat-associated protein